uniref:Protein kinase domain-containing protein n=1 Tax=Scylla olivacea TaxID=85551 RepID=A0A0P4VZ56_SCYOL
MIPWAEKTMLKVVAVWVCADVVALTVSPRRGGWLMMLLMLLIGMVCKITLAGLFILAYLLGRPCSFRHSIGTSRVLTPFRSSCLSLAAAAERRTGKFHDVLAELAHLWHLEMVDGRMVGPQLTTENLLGEGAFGRVYKLDVADVEAPVCIKVAKDPQSGNFLREIRNLRRVEGMKGVPRVVAISGAPEGFIMTMHGRRTLENWLRIWEKARPRERDVASVLHKLCAIMTKLHALGVCHNDLKGDNVMVEVDRTQKRKRWAKCKVTLVDFAMLGDYGEHPLGVQRVMFLPHNDPALMRKERVCSEVTDVFSMGYLLHRTLPLLASHRQSVAECSQRAMGAFELRPSFAEIEKVLKDAQKSR